MSRNFSSLSRSQLFAPGRIPVRENAGTITSARYEDPPDSVGSASSDMPLPPIPLLQEWSRYRRTQLKWDEMPSRADERSDVRRCHEAGPQSTRRSFIRHHQGDYQVPETVDTDRLFAKSQIEVVAIALMNDYATHNVGGVASVDPILFDIRSMFPMRNYAGRTEETEEHVERSQDRFHWLAVLRLGKVIAWRDAMVVASHSIPVLASRDESIENWAQSAIHVSLDSFPDVPKFLLVGERVLPEGMSAPEMVSLIHFAGKLQSTQEEMTRATTGSGRRERLGQQALLMTRMMNVERAVVTIQSVALERMQNRWVPVFSVGLVSTLVQYFPEARRAATIGDDGITFLSLIRECTRARLTSPRKMIAVRRSLSENLMRFVPLEELAEVKVGSGDLAESLARAEVVSNPDASAQAGPSTTTTTGENRVAPNVRMSVPLRSAPTVFPSFSAVRRAARAERGSASTDRPPRPPAASGSGGTNGSAGQGTNNNNNTTGPSESTPPAQPSATTTPSSTGQDPEPTTNTGTDDSNTVSSMLELGSVRFRLDEFLAQYPHFRPVLGPIMTPGKELARAREVFQRFNGHLREMDPTATRVNRGGRRVESRGTRLRGLEEDNARLRRELEDARRRNEELWERNMRLTEGPSRQRGTSRGRNEDDEDRRSSQRRRYNDDDRDDRHDDRWDDRRRDDRRRH